jgi:hypothetical protein
VLGATSFFDGYDRGITTGPCPRSERPTTSPKVPHPRGSPCCSSGAVPAVALARQADRLGRRTLLVVSILGYSVATAATTLAPTIATYAACQFTARVFRTAQTAIVWVMAAEELPDAARGLGFGWLAMNSALGVGFGAILYGSVFTPLNISWRQMYLVGLPALAHPHRNHPPPTTRDETLHHRPDRRHHPTCPGTTSSGPI